jgi:16S rRNA (uracil1498-N3)-methyltransferase
MVLVDDLEVPVLSDLDQHHLERVLRVRAGAAITIADGGGRWRTARFGATVEPTGPIVVQAREDPPLAIGFALVKGDRPEGIVQRLTELGIDRIVPFRAARSVVRWDDEKAAKAVVRLRAVARGAAMQSHRPRLPEVAEVTTLEVLAAEPGVALADRPGAPPTLRHPTVLVGPEGGWSTEELELDLPRVALGGNVLRAETAAITAGGLLAALRRGILAERG